MLKLKQVLEEIGSTQRELAQHLQISSAGVAQICNHGIYPKKPNEETVKAGVLEYLKQRGASVEVCRRVFDEVQPKQPQEETMLLRKQTLTPAARKHFGLFRDPFADDLQTHEDVFLTDDVRYVRETLWHTARHGGFVAITGESGAGKSTLRRDLIDRIARENQQIVVIEVGADQLTDGYTHLSMNVPQIGAAKIGCVLYIKHDLKVQRRPANLPNLLNPGAANA